MLEFKFNGSIESAESNQNGIEISGGGMAYFDGLTVENNMNNGIDIWQSGTWLSGTNLFESNDTGINIGTGGKLSFNKDSITTISESTIGLNSGQADVKLAGEITISNNTEKGINVNLSTFRTEESTKLEIQNIASGKAFSAYRSKLEIRNLTATGDGSTNNNLVEIGDGCSSDLRNIYVSNSGGDGIKFNNAESYIDNISSINNKDGVNVWRSNVTIKNASITNNEDNGIEISQGSSSSLYSSTISSNQNEGVSAKRKLFVFEKF